MRFDTLILADYTHFQVVLQRVKGWDGQVFRLQSSDMHTEFFDRVRMYLPSCGIVRYFDDGYQIQAGDWYGILASRTWNEAAVVTINDADAATIETLASLLQGTMPPYTNALANALRHIPWLYALHIVPPPAERPYPNVAAPVHVYESCYHNTIALLGEWYGHFVARVNPAHIDDCHLDALRDECIVWTPNGVKYTKWRDVAKAMFTPVTVASSCHAERDLALAELLQGKHVDGEPLIHALDLWACYSTIAREMELTV